MNAVLIHTFLSTAVAALSVAQAVELPLNMDFTSGKDFRVGPLNGQQGWKTEQGTAQIQEEEGTFYLSIPPQEPSGQASVYFSPPASPQPLFLDLEVRLGAGNGNAEFADANGSLAALVRVDSEGRLLARHQEESGGAEWLDTQVRLALDGSGTMRDWTRMTIRQDPLLGTWDLYVNGLMKAANFGSLPDEREATGYFTLLGDATHEVRLRRLAIADKNMLFPDADADGLPDAWQDKLSRRGRDEDPDVDGLTNLEEYVAGTNPRLADTDGDGVSDAGELRAGTDPLKAQEQEPGGVVEEFWLADNSGLTTLPASLYDSRHGGLFSRPVSLRSALNRLDFQGVLDNHYVSRVRGLITAPVSGDYTFWVAGNDTAEFWLSGDDAPFLRKFIARSHAPSGYHAFDEFASQKSRQVRLEAGQSYYFEVLHRATNGQNHFSVAWQAPGQRREIIGGKVLSAWTGDARDANDDGLPDEWQKAHGLSVVTGKREAEADPDRDRLTNLEEYRYGTDPQKPDAAARRGLITRDVWFGMPGRYLFDAANGGSEFPRNPWWTEYLEEFEGPRDVGQDFLGRIRGAVIIPESGEYSFHIAADDQAELWLGKGPENSSKEKVATVPVYTAWHQWRAFPSQTSTPRVFEKGEVLYIEALHKQGLGDNHLSVAWTRPGRSAPEVISGENLVSWSSQPDDADDNGLPDEWEAQRGLRNQSAGGLNFRKSSAVGDADGDGVSNEAERLAGTNPMDVSAFPSTGLSWELWDGVPGNTLTGLEAIRAFPSGPSRRKALVNLDYAGVGTNYLSRVRGYVVPPVTGNYTFSLAGADNCEFWLSTDDSPFHKNRIAQVAVFTPWRHREWNSKQSSVLLPLEAGKKYYVEILHKKGAGPDHLSAGWNVPGMGQTILLGDFLVPYAGTPADQDDDGLPDDWETAHGLNSAVAAGADGAFGDPDHDLLNNYQEWRSGSDPQRADVAKIPGLALWELWESVPGITLDRLTGNPRFPALPDHRVMLDSAEVPPDRGSWYGGRLRGFLVPPVSGKYQVLVSGDDQAALYVSSSESKFERKLITQTPFWTGQNDFKRYPQQSAQVSFEAGKLYFFELLHKQGEGRDHAALAWIPPGAVAPEIPSGKLIAAFTTDPADLDDDELPDSWETAFKLDPRDNGNVEYANGAWGDPDGDSLPNLTEWRLGTNPTTTDSDGDGLDDDFEYYITGTNAAVKDGLTLLPAARVPGSSAVVIKGRGAVSGQGFTTSTPSGTVAFPFTLETDGVAYFKLSAGIYPFAAKTPMSLVIKADGVELGSIPLNQLDGPPGSASGKLPYLPKGAHTLEASWALPERDKTISFVELEVFQSPAGTAPPLRGDDAVNAVTSTVTESLTSPFCLEGTAAYAGLVRLDNVAKVVPLPDRAWYADVPLPEDGKALNVNISFENGLKTQTTAITWKACNVFETGNLLIRAGDALRLTAIPEGGLQAGAKVKVLVNGVASADTTPEVPVEHVFSEPGIYTVTAEVSFGDGTPLKQSIEVKAVRVNIPEPLVFYSGQSRTVALPGLSEEAEAFPDPLIYFTEHSGTAPRTFTLGGGFRGDALIAFRLPGRGPVLKSATVRSVILFSDVDTYYYTAETLPDGTRIVEMDVFMPIRTPGLKLRVDIIVAGVTFEDGSVTKWLTTEDFDDSGMAKLRFAVSPGVATSFCHQMTLLEGDTVLGTR